jgi:hypothetical protein
MAEAHVMNGLNPVNNCYPLFTNRPVALFELSDAVVSRMLRMFAYLTTLIELNRCDWPLIRRKIVKECWSQVILLLCVYCSETADPIMWQRHPSNAFISNKMRKLITISQRLPDILALIQTCFREKTIVASSNSSLATNQPRMHTSAPISVIKY